MLKEFRSFAMQGNMLDLAIGVVIGAAFGTIVTSLVNDVIMPPLGLLLGQVDFSNMFAVLKEGTTPAPYSTVKSAQEAGAVTLNFGLFISAIINFLIVAFALFFVVRSINRMKKAQAEAPAAPPEPTAEEKLLVEIRDLLKAKA